MSAEVNWGSVADWVGGLATALALIVALFKESAWAWWMKPKLGVRVDLRPPDSHRTLIQVGDDLHPAYYLRLLITNIGRTKATSVQVHVDRLRCDDGAGFFFEDENFVPMNLTWAHIGGPYMERIIPGLSRHVDLGHTPKPGNPWIGGPRGIERGQTWFSMSLEVGTFIGTHLLKPGRYRLDMTAAGENTDPVKFTLEFFLQGEWHDEQSTMFREGMTLRRLKYGA